MIPNDQPLRSTVIKRMLETVNKNMQYLTEWEQDFIYSVYDQFEKKGDLSLKQTEILERIYDK